MKNALAVVLSCLLLGVAHAAGLDEVNTKIGTISHMLVPVFPVIQRPGALLRMVPVNESARADTADGFGLTLPAHRFGMAFRMMPLPAQGESSVFHYDHSEVKPYRYSVFVEESEAQVEFAPAEQSAVYAVAFEGKGSRRILIEPRQDGGQVAYDAEARAVRGFENFRDNTKVYVWLESDMAPVATRAHPSNDKRLGVILEFPPETKSIRLRYGISYIDEAQAKANLRREIKAFELEKLAEAAEGAWEKALNQIRVKGGTDDERAVFYSALYRCQERMVKISEDGRYYSGFDRKVHADGGVPFWTDDWVWDSFHALHPLMCILKPSEQAEKLTSYVRMAEQNQWYPTFPQVFGDAHCMNGQHAFSLFLDAYRKGIRGFDFAKATDYMVKSAQEASFLPWYRGAATALDKFYWEQGFYPGLKEGEKETFVSEVSTYEKRQCVAVTLAAAYDSWCVAESLKELGRTTDESFFRKHSLDYRNLWKADTTFFHPKDAEGRWIEPFDYKYSGGTGARDYYDENNGWIYNWEVYHNIPDLVNLFGGPEKMAAKLDQMYAEPMNRTAWSFYNHLPDSTGLVGMYSMANEPCLHIPYLYNYIGQPWKTQKRTRMLLETWWRNDHMGVCGDDDGGGLSSFAIFSMMGFYPVTPGLPTYTLTSPVFTKVSIALENGKTFTVSAPKASASNKYIQSVKINGKAWNSPFFSHDVIVNGGTIEIELGPRPNKAWGVEP